MTRALIVYPTGQTFLTDITANLANLQAIVGGDIEGVYPRDSEWVHAYINENGKFDANCLPNETATTMLGLTGYDEIRGVAVFLCEDDEGEEADISDEFVNRHAEITGVRV